MSRNELGIRLSAASCESATTEADFLYRSLFTSGAPDSVLGGYAKALAQLFPGERIRREVDIQRLVERRLDAVAIEFYLRVRYRELNELTQRLHVLIYLAELRPEQFSRFTVSEPARVRAWVALGKVGLFLPFILIKGWYQTTRHRLAERAER